MWSVFPGGILAIFQFIPLIRARQPKIHRTLGYACWFFGVIAAASSLLIFDHSFGGAPSTKVAILSLSAIALLGHYKAYRAIKQFELDKHREWMMRIWIYMGSIVTMRPVFILMAFTISFMRRWGIPGASMYATMELPCEQIFYMLTNGDEIGVATRKPDFFSTYGASCTSHLTGLQSPYTTLNGSKTSPIRGYDAILSGAKASITGTLLTKRVDLRAAAFDITFGWGFLAAIVLHMFLLELYFRMTPKEAERLKKLGEQMRETRRKKVEMEQSAAIIERDSSSDSDVAIQIKNLKSKSVRIEVREVKMEEEFLSKLALAGAKTLPHCSTQ